MKRIVCLFLALMLAFGACAFAGSTYTFEYVYNDFFVYDVGTQAYVYAQLENPGQLGGGTLTAQLIDQTDGTVLGEKEFSASNATRPFGFVLPEDWFGVHYLAVYVNGEKCSADFPVFVKEHEKCLKRVATTENKIAVTVDCGSGGNINNAKWRALFEKYGGHATFFVTARWASEHPEAVQAIVAAGHEIGNHSYTHPHWETLNGWEDWYYEIMEAQETITEIAGVTPTLFRVPHGDWSYPLKTVLRDLGFKELVQWNISSNDSTEGITNSEILAKSMPANVPAGSIILFHNDDPAIDELDKVFDYYVNTLGYELVTVSELIGDEDYTIDDNFVLTPAQ